MRIIAGIVLYNPDIKRLLENVNSIYPQVDSLIIVDNASKNCEQAIKMLQEFKNIEIICNDKNKGIATALNQIMHYAIEYSASWVLTLDQDSVCEHDLISQYYKYISKSDVGMMTCNVVDRNFGIDYGVGSTEYRYVEGCITSGSFVNVKSYKKTAGFDEKMFIDKVDFDYCLSVRATGQKIIKINYNGLLHEVGHGRIIKLFGKSYTMYNHSYIRRFYMVRNGIYIAKKHKKSLNIFRELLKEVRGIILVLLYENDKLKKLKYGIKGLIEGLFMQIN